MRAASGGGGGGGGSTRTASKPQSTPSPGVSGQRSSLAGSAGRGAARRGRRGRNVEVVSEERRRASSGTAALPGCRRARGAETCSLASKPNTSLHSEHHMTALGRRSGGDGMESLTSAAKHKNVFTAAINLNNNAVEPAGDSRLCGLPFSSTAALGSSRTGTLSNNNNYNNNEFVSSRAVQRLMDCENEITNTCPSVVTSEGCFNGNCLTAFRNVANLETPTLFSPTNNNLKLPSSEQDCEKNGTTANHQVQKGCNSSGISSKKQPGDCGARARKGTTQPLVCSRVTKCVTKCNSSSAPKRKEKSRLREFAPPVPSNTRSDQDCHDCRGQDSPPPLPSLIFGVEASRSDDCKIADKLLGSDPDGLSFRSDGFVTSPTNCICSPQTPLLNSPTSFLNAPLLPCSGACVLEAQDDFSGSVHPVSQFGAIEDSQAGVGWLTEHLSPSMKNNLLVPDTRFSSSSSSSVNSNCVTFSNMISRQHNNTLQDENLMLLDEHSNTPQNDEELNSTVDEHDDTLRDEHDNTLQDEHDDVCEIAQCSLASIVNSSSDLVRTRCDNGIRNVVNVKPHSALGSASMVSNSNDIINQRILTSFASASDSSSVTRQQSRNLYSGVEKRLRNIDNMRLQIRDQQQKLQCSKPGSYQQFSARFSKLASLEDQFDKVKLFNRNSSDDNSTNTCLESAGFVKCQGSNDNFCLRSNSGHVVNRREERPFGMSSSYDGPTVVSLSGNLTTGHPAVMTKSPSTPAVMTTWYERRNAIGMWPRRERCLFDSGGCLFDEAVEGKVANCNSGTYNTLDKCAERKNNFASDKVPNYYNISGEFANVDISTDPSSDSFSTNATFSGDSLEMKTQLPVKVAQFNNGPTAKMGTFKQSSFDASSVRSKVNFFENCTAQQSMTTSSSIHRTGNNTVTVSRIGSVVGTTEILGTGNNVVTTPVLGTFAHFDALSDSCRRSVFPKCDSDQNINVNHLSAKNERDTVKCVGENDSGLLNLNDLGADVTSKRLDVGPAHLNFSSVDCSNQMTREDVCSVASNASSLNDFLDNAADCHDGASIAGGAGEYPSVMLQSDLGHCCLEKKEYMV